MMDGRFRGEDGSMLIEVLVAFIILASAIVAAFQVFGDGLRRIKAVEPRMQAIAVARNEFARIGSQTGAPPTQLEGADQTGLRWRMVFSPINAGQVDWTPIRPFRAKLWIGTSAQDGGEGELVLETIVLAPAAAKP